MKFGGNQSFHLRDSWLHKGIKSIMSDPKIFSRENAVERLGLGKNMVESLKYWLEASQLVIGEKNGHFPTEFCFEIFKNDPYFELDGTLHLIHYLLATNQDDATVFFWFFNKFAATEFDTSSLTIYFNSYVQGLDKKVNENTLIKDINCLLRMYRKSDFKEKSNPESENPSPFLKFALIEEHDNKLTKRFIHSSEINPQIFVYCLYLFWKTKLKEAESISLEDIASKECSPGLIFGLSIDGCSQIIDEISRNIHEKYLEFNKTGGYYIVNLNKKTAKNALAYYYRDNKAYVE